MSEKRRIKFRGYLQDEFKTKWTFDLLEMLDFTKEELEKMEIVQFTGYYDQDGKEIYEWDIVQGPNKIPIPITDMRFFNWLSKSNVKIIGNIYENSELLE